MRDSVTDADGKCAAGSGFSVTIDKINIRHPAIREAEDGSSSSRAPSRPKIPSIDP